MQFDLLTIFPKILDSYFNESILGKAQKNSLVRINTHDIRTFSKDKHKAVDDKPFGGGPGMVMQVQPIYDCLQSIKRKKRSKVILLDPRGKQFNQTKAKKLAKLDQIVFIAGRYQDLDARISKLIDEKISIGPYILSGGELASAVVIEAVSRCVPGVLGNEESLVVEDSYFKQYTRPSEFKTSTGDVWRVPKVLLSGNHKKIDEWRQQN